MGRMVAAVHFYATESDQDALLDYLGEPDAVSLHDWPVFDLTRRLTRAEALQATHVMIADPTYGQPIGIAAGEAGPNPSARATVFDLLNRERLDLADDDLLVDTNASPVLLWRPATQDGATLLRGHIGSQADSMGAVSADYERWAKRVMGWVRRRGTRVWGLDRGAAYPGLDVSVSDLTTCYALPHAHALLIGDGRGR